MEQHSATLQLMAAGKLRPIFAACVPTCPSVTSLAVHRVRSEAIGAIIGATIGAVATVVLVIACFVLLRGRRRTRLSRQAIVQAKKVVVADAKTTGPTDSDHARSPGSPSSKSRITARQLSFERRQLSFERRAKTAPSGMSPNGVAPPARTSTAGLEDASPARAGASKAATAAGAEAGDATPLQVSENNELPIQRPATEHSSLNTPIADGSAATVEAAEREAAAAEAKAAALVAEAELAAQTTAAVLARVRGSSHAMDAADEDEDEACKAASPKLVEGPRSNNSVDATRVDATLTQDPNVGMRV